MNDCRWLKPVLVGQFEFTEWTPDNHLRHSRFVALRDDKDPKDVVRKDEVIVLLLPWLSQLCVLLGSKLQPDASALLPDCLFNLLASSRKTRFMLRTVAKKINKTV